MKKEVIKEQEGEIKDQEGGMKEQEDGMQEQDKKMEEHEDGVQVQEEMENHNGGIYEHIKIMEEETAEEVFGVTIHGIKYALEENVPIDASELKIEHSHKSQIGAKKAHYEKLRYTRTELKKDFRNNKIHSSNELVAMTSKEVLNKSKSKWGKYNFI